VTSLPPPALQVDQLPAAPLSLAPVSALALRLHDVPGEEALLRALGAGITALGLRHALYLASPDGARLLCHSHTFSPETPLLPALPLSAVSTLLADPARLLAEGEPLPFLAGERPLASGNWAVLALRQGAMLLACLILHGSALAQADPQALSLLAEHAALALGRVRAMQQLRAAQPHPSDPAPRSGVSSTLLQRRNRVLSTVNAVSRALDEHPELSSRLRAALDALIRLGVADAAALLAATGPGRPPTPLVSQALPAALSDALAACRLDTVDRQALPGQRPVHFAEPASLARVLGIPPLPVSDLRSWTLVSLEHRGQREGLLLLGFAQAGDPRARDKRLIASLAQEIAVSMANARLYVAQREAADLSTILLEVARSLAAQADLGHVLSTISELTPRLVGCTRGVVWRYDAERAIVSPWHGSGLNPQQLSVFHAVLFVAADVPFVTRVIEGGRSLVIDHSNLSLLPDWMVQFFDVRSILLVPLICKGRPLGIIAVDQPGAAHTFSPRDIAVVEGIASHAALAIENARLYEQTAHRADQLASLYESGRALSTSLSLADLLTTVPESAARLVGADWCLLSFIDDQTGHLAPVRHWSAHGDEAPSSALAGLDLARQTVAAGQSVVIGHGAAYLPDSATGPVGSVASVPLLSKGRVIGALDVILRATGSFSAEDLRLLEAFAGQAAAALENARLFQQLADGKRAWEETFDAITDGICVRDQDCRIVRANRALARSVGVPVEALIGTRLCDQLPELHESCAICQGLTADDLSSDVTEIRRLGPEPLVLTVQDYPNQPAGQGEARWVTVIRDVTAERRMRDTLIRSEKLRALGEMASGVAHDFNNLLAAILARAELSLLEEPCPDGQHGFETIRRAALDGVAMVRRIQEYSRVRHDRERRQVDLSEIAQSVVDLSRHKWKDVPERAGIRIDMVLDLHPVPPVWGNPSDLREVLMNLIFNAVDAMPSGGSITVSTGLVGDRVMLTVSDTGCGMSEDLQRRIFDPFFTTKGEGGSGLGLSVSYGIVARYGGDIVVQSAPGAGSTFTIRLPAASENPDAAEPQTETLPKPVPVARILLVDDDADVLESVAELLRRDGHQVTALSSSAQALRHFQPGAYDYVITDLGMPELNGWELASALRALQPTLPIFLLTGWHAELSNEHAGARGVSAVLAKPCTLADLRRVMAAHPLPGSARAEPPAPGAAAPEPALSVPAPAPSAPPAPLRVLVVDDQPQFAEAVAGRLRLEGHSVTIVGTGGEGVARAQRQPFDLAIVDLRLPDMLGTEVAATMRALPHPPYVVLATGMAISQGDAGLADAADDVLPKPWTSGEFQRVLAHAAQRTEANARLALSPMARPPTG